VNEVWVVQQVGVASWDPDPYHVAERGDALEQAEWVASERAECGERGQVCGRYLSPGHLAAPSTEGYLELRPDGPDRSGPRREEPFERVDLLQHALR
jgi:hypothetical protein